jgi:hypothetical protein
MTFPWPIRLGAGDNVAIAINSVDQGVTGLTARERILRGHKVVLEPIQGIAEFLLNAVLARRAEQLFDLRISPYFERLVSHFEDASTWRQAPAEYRAIRNAIANADREGARRAMVHHLMCSQERFSGGFGKSAIK